MFPQVPVEDAGKIIPIGGEIFPAQRRRFILQFNPLNLGMGMALPQQNHEYARAATQIKNPSGRNVPHKIRQQHCVGGKGKPFRTLPELWATGP